MMHAVQLLIKVESRQYKRHEGTIMKIEDPFQRQAGPVYTLLAIIVFTKAAGH
jgi:hypothetical protein